MHARARVVATARVHAGSPVQHKKRGEPQRCVGLSAKNPLVRLARGKERSTRPP